jgi:hypothetical protein
VAVFSKEDYASPPCSPLSSNTVLGGLNPVPAEPSAPIQQQAASGGAINQSKNQHKPASESTIGDKKPVIGEQQGGVNQQQQVQEGPFVSVVQQIGNRPLPAVQRPRPSAVGVVQQQQQNNIDQNQANK